MTKLFMEKFPCAVTIAMLYLKIIFCVSSGYFPSYQHIFTIHCTYDYYYLSCLQNSDKLSDQIFLFLCSFTV